MTKDIDSETELDRDTTTVENEDQEVESQDQEVENRDQPASNKNQESLKDQEPLKNQESLFKPKLNSKQMGLLVVVAIIAIVIVVAAILIVITNTIYNDGSRSFISANDPKDIFHNINALLIGQAVTVDSGFATNLLLVLAIIILCCLVVLQAIYSAQKAQAKGYTYWIFFLSGLLLPIIILLISDIVPNRIEARED
jgi:hypothetical protein